jgi:hypothetical protein
MTNPYDTYSSPLASRNAGSAFGDPQASNKKPRPAVRGVDPGDAISGAVAVIVQCIPGVGKGSA